MFLFFQALNCTKFERMNNNNDNIIQWIALSTVWITGVWVVELIFLPFNEWSYQFFLYPVKGDQYSFYCIPCRKNTKCDHQGIIDVKNHFSTGTHKRYEKQAKSEPSVSSLFKSQERKHSVTWAEVIMTNFLVQHNLPLATSDHLWPLYRSAFPDVQYWVGG